MKKLICAALAALLMLSAAALADEYTFQTIPWGASVQEAKAILTERGLIREEDYEAQGVQAMDSEVRDVRMEWCAYCPDGSDDEVMWDALAGNSFISGVGTQYYLSNLSKTIGGQDVEVKLNFLFDIKDGAIVPDMHLTMVNVLFDDRDDITGEALEEKLTAQYGTCEKRDLYSGYTLCRWNGDNDTAVFLVYYEHNENSSPNLTYAKTSDYLKVSEMLALNGVKEDAGL